MDRNEPPWVSTVIALLGLALLAITIWGMVKH